MHFHIPELEKCLSIDLNIQRNHKTYSLRFIDRSLKGKQDISGKDKYSLHCVVKNTLP